MAGDVDEQSAVTKDLPKKDHGSGGKEGTESYPATLDYLSPNADLNTGTQWYVPILIIRREY